MTQHNNIFVYLISVQFSKNRIIASAGRDRYAHPVPPRAMAGLPPSSSAAQGPIQLRLERLQGWGPTASLGNYPMSGWKAASEVTKSLKTCLLLLLKKKKCNSVYETVLYDTMMRENVSR